MRERRSRQVFREFVRDRNVPEEEHALLQHVAQERAREIYRLKDRGDPVAEMRFGVYATTPEGRFPEICGHTLNWAFKETPKACAVEYVLLLDEPKRRTVAYVQQIPLGAYSLWPENAA